MKNMSAEQLRLIEMAAGAGSTEILVESSSALAMVAEIKRRRRDHLEVADILRRGLPVKVEHDGWEWQHDARAWLARR